MSRRWNRISYRQSTIIMNRIFSSGVVYKKKMGGEFFWKSRKKSRGIIQQCLFIFKRNSQKASSGVKVNFFFLCTITASFYFPNVTRRVYLIRLNISPFSISFFHWMDGGGEMIPQHAVDWWGEISPLFLGCTLILLGDNKQLGYTRTTLSSNKWWG